MAAFSHNGEPGSALDAELKGRDTRHMEGYSAGFKAGREAGLREAAAIVGEQADSIGEISNSHVAVVVATFVASRDAILSAIGDK